MNPVQIIDAVMGTGKSTWAINEVNNNPENKYIVLTPLLTEVARYKEGISSDYNGKRPDVVALDEEGSRTKIQRFKDLKIQSGTARR